MFVKTRYSNGAFLTIRHWQRISRLVFIAVLPLRHETLHRAVGPGVVGKDAAVAAGQVVPGGDGGADKFIGTGALVADGSSVGEVPGGSLERLNERGKYVEKIRWRDKDTKIEGN